LALLFPGKWGFTPRVGGGSAFYVSHQGPAITMNPLTMLLWALPIAVSLHVFEEFACPGGLRQWIKACKPSKPKSDFWYVFVNAVAIVAAFKIAWKAPDTLAFRVYLFIAAIMAGNAASHIRGAIQMKQYCPGVVTGGLLLLPLSVIGYWYLLGTGKVDLPSAIICFCIGIFFGFYVFGVDIKEKDRKKT
jgi:hypothetical protein